MKKFLAIMLAVMLALCSTLTAFAEDANSNTDQPQQMGDGAPEGTPSKMPESEFPGGPGMGTPPEMPEGGFLGGYNERWVSGGGLPEGQSLYGFIYVE